MPLCSCPSPCPDPYYESEPARWVRHEAEDRHGIQVEVLDDLDADGYSSRAAQAIWVLAGLSFESFFWVVARSVAHQLFGIDPSLELQAPVDDVRRFARDAVILPFPRRPLSGHLPA